MSTIDVAFWNVNMGERSRTAKKEAFTNWIEENMPDVLFLEELSARLVHQDAVDQLTPAGSEMKLVGYVNTLDVNDNPTTKCLAVLVRDSMVDKVACRAGRFPELTQRRACIKLCKDELQIWALHANASNTGGRAAVVAARDRLRSTSGGVTLVGGDYNYPIADAATEGLAAVHPFSWQKASGHSVPLRFTQWNDRASSYPRKSDVHLDKEAGLQITLSPNDVIDYVAGGPRLTVTSYPNCETEKVWRDILINFDHCPVYYEIKY